LSKAARRPGKTKIISKIEDSAPTDILRRIGEIVGSVSRIDIMYGQKININPEVIIE
jgi:hypothetical protein